MLKSTAQDRVWNNLKRGQMLSKSGEEECEERSTECKRKKVESQCFTVMHGRGINEDRDV